MSLEHEIAFTLNGRPATATVPVRMSALTMLRDVFALTGTKEGCNEGECGACTILVDGASLNACLLFAVDCAGRDVMTVEGVGADGDLDRVQKALVKHGAVQCGFCTPGIVMQARYLADHGTCGDGDDAVKRGLEGNLCRCTGYKKIIEAVVAVCRRPDASGANHDDD